MMLRVVSPAVLLALLVTAVPVAAQAPGLQARIDGTPSGGELVLEEGVYEGGIVIDRPMTLRGLPGAVVDGGGEGTAIEVIAPDVTITGLVIRNTGDSLDRENAGISANAPRVEITDNVFENVLFGVFLRSATDSLVARNDIGAKDLGVARRGDGIRLWESDGSTVVDNVVDGGRDVVLWFSDDLTIRGNVVTDGRYGLHFMYSDDALVERNRLASNSVGGFLMYSRGLTLLDNVFEDNYGPSGYGIGLKDMDGIVATGNHFVGNRVGVYLDNSPWSAGEWQTFSGNLFAYNRIGIEFLPSVKRNAFTANAFVDNGEQVGVVGGRDFSGNAWSVDGVGNYWSDFAGYDADGDGIGDIPHRVTSLYSSLTDEHPAVRLFDETPAARALDHAALMFPIMRPQEKVTDEAPLVRRPAIRRAVDAPTPNSGPLVGVGLLFVGGAAALILTSRRGVRGGMAA
ncbi:MAG: nitrous oxide reductase family maturation protein NosD [Acidimicrobiia bacterium]|nr:nitrous oxide reductase family maturation protein NosD [Acidimicrobiia bacterium]